VEEGRGKRVRRAWIPDPEAGEVRRPELDLETEIRRLSEGLRAVRLTFEAAVMRLRELESLTPIGPSLEQRLTALEARVVRLSRDLEEVRAALAPSEEAPPRPMVVRPKAELTEQDVRNLPWQWFKGAEGRRGWLVADPKVRRTRAYELDDDQAAVLAALVGRAKAEGTAVIGRAAVALSRDGRFLRVALPG